jgi:hypothetical protein
MMSGNWVLEVQLALGERLLDEDGEMFEVGRFGEKVVGAVVHRLDRAFDGAVAGEDDDRHGRVL